MFLWCVLSVLVFINCNGGNVEKHLLKVDESLDKVDEIRNKRLSQIDSLYVSTKLISDTHERIEALINIAANYQAFDLEKSLACLLEANKYATTHGEVGGDSIKTLLRIASLFNSEGMMVKEASEIFESLDPSEMDPQTKKDYFILGVQINKNLGDRSIIEELKDRYRALASSYRDSVLLIDGRSSIIAANRLVENGDLEGALALMMREMPGDEENNQRKGPYYHYLAGLYRQMGDRDHQLEYLAKAASDDLKNGVTEYMALTELAELLETTDPERAYQYIQRSRRDAESSHSSLRQREVTPIYEVITHAHAERQRRKISTVIIISLSLAIICILAAGAAFQLKKKNRLLNLQTYELQKGRDRLDAMNLELAKTNQILKNESKIKSHYINSFMELCLSYLAKMESFRARLGKVASSGNIKKIMDAINSSRYVNQEISEFYDSFDQTFLTLYPDFIPQLNSLLKDNDQYKASDRLTTELRIYALIRLGIKSSGEIAKFLRCSESTVYNYRTQMRHRAKDRETFEKDFLML